MNEKAAVPSVSSGVMKVFAAYNRRYLCRHFTALRLAKEGSPPAERTRPLVIYLNHASWWDPLVCLRLSRALMPGRASFAPIDAAMLERYGFFKRLGFFGIEPNSPRGGFKFLRTAHRLLASSGNALWITPQGRFTDVRERPLRLQEGLGALASHAGNAAFVPLAIEYPFWSEPRPEILVSFGKPIVPSLEPAQPSAEWTRIFSDALEATQNDLALRSCRRDASDWQTLDRGRSGVNTIYDTWRQIRARMRGEHFSPEHLPEAAR